MIISERLIELFYEYHQQGKLMVEYMCQDNQDKVDECIEFRKTLSEQINVEKKKLEWLEIHYIRLN